jgi:hypothetical protein
LDPNQPTVDKALARVQTILDTTRHPVLAHESEEDHTYDDKFALAEFLINTGIAAKMNALERLGLGPDQLEQVVGWVHLQPDKPSVTMRLEATDSCHFLKENIVDLVTTTTAGAATTQSFETTTTTSTSLFGMGPPTKTKTEVTKSKVVTQVKEYHWKVGLQYRLIIFKGSNSTGADVLELQSRTASTVLITSGGGKPNSLFAAATKHNNSPLNELTVHSPIDINLTWLFQRISPKQLQCQFTIDRMSIKANKTCKTPRRNADMDGAFEFDRNLYDWTVRTRAFFLDRVEHQIMGKHQPNNRDENDDYVFPVGAICTIVGLKQEPGFNGKKVRVAEHFPEQQRYRVDPVVEPKSSASASSSSGLPSTMLLKPQHLKFDWESSSPPPVAKRGPSLHEIDDETVFGPVLPLLEKGSILSMGDVADFLTEQNRSMDEAIDALIKSYAPRQLMKLVSVAEATLVLLCQHMQLLTRQCSQGVDYLEDMLLQQLVTAIGKEVTSKDFDQFMRFHNQRFFGGAYAPRPFSLAIRRPNHYPDGTLSIEAAITGSNNSTSREPIETWVRHVIPSTPNSFFMIPINAATLLQVRSDACFLHGWMQHRFQGRRRPAFELTARARQFSSFLLLVGTMMGPGKFDPKNAIILQNKDEVMIPLLTNTLPSAKEFKDAIASLSPEQKAFASSFRSMQLESSVFAVCVIQVKPQLERLLELPDGALTKEIQLTQDLMSMFVDYQIPSDLLSFDGDPSCALAEKVATVKGYVKAVTGVIEGEKKKQLQDEAMKADMRAEMMFSAAQSTDPIGEGCMPMNDVSETSQGSGRRLSRMKRSQVCATPPAATLFGAQAHPIAFGAAPPAATLFGAQAHPIAFGAAPPAAKLFGAPAHPIAFGAPTDAFTAVPRLRQKMLQQQVTTPPVLSVSTVPLQPSQQQQKLVSQDVTGLWQLGESVPSLSSGGEDFTAIPKILDAKLEKYDTDNALRSTIIKVNQNWTRMRQANLLTPVSSYGMEASDIETEKKKAFDLLDAISRSGTLPIDCAELHVMIAVSHCFENDVM